MYQFVICVDVKAENMTDAYRGLLQRMNANDWESTDEAYYPDGKIIKLMDLDKARLEVLSVVEAL